MTQEKAGLGEQAINKIAEIALASQLEKVERLEVRVKTDLSKLAHGEVDAIAIKLNGLVIQQNLRTEELQLQINRVTVKPLSALLGKIKLTQPSTGTVSIVINQDDFTHAFNCKFFHQHLHQMPSFVEARQKESCFQQVKCDLLADGNIVFNCKVLDETGEVQPVSFTATPQIEAEGQGIDFQNTQYIEGKELSSELTTALLARASEVLSLRNFEQKGMTLRIGQLDVAAGKLTLQANAYIKQFPSS